MIEVTKTTNESYHFYFTLKYDFYLFTFRYFNLLTYE